MEFPAALLAFPLLPSPSGRERGDPSVSTHPGDMVEALSEVLRTQILHGSVPCIEVAAEIAGTSKRTLQRRLGEEGLSYRRLIDRVRFQIAREMLREGPDATVKNVARGAGFAGSGTFIRSFHRMTGMTPGEYQRRNP